MLLYKKFLLFKIYYNIEQKIFKAIYLILIKVSNKIINYYIVYSIYYHSLNFVKLLILL